MVNQAEKRPVVLCILDGWGYRKEFDSNAILAAKTPTWNRLLESCPVSLLKTSGEDVGLPKGQMGNSEVGHMNIGAGRVVLQDLPRIDQAITDGSIRQNTNLVSTIEKMKQSRGTCHIAGLISPGGVHSHQDHLVEMVKIVSEAGIPVVVHMWLDGRDTPPASGREYAAKFVRDIRNCPNVEIGTISGRYYAMDRDKRWDRIALAYKAMVIGDGTKADTVLGAITNGYDRGETDEFITPTVIKGYQGIRHGDAFICGNFRADRVRQILIALVDPLFSSFIRQKVVQFSAFTGMTEYSEDLNKFITTFFPPQQINNSIGEVISKAGLKQLRTAETEKYPHVTFFFNGGAEHIFEGESRTLVNSPQVATYDLKPEMSAYELTDKLIESVESKQHDFIVVNYANPDMVGHTGQFDATVKAVETVDICLGKLEDAIIKANGTLLVTADHGNAEYMRDSKTSQPHTAHTTNPVQLILVNGPKDITKLQDGRLADIAPTLLSLLNIQKPSEMTGQSLLQA